MSSMQSGWTPSTRPRPSPGTAFGQGCTIDLTDATYYVGHVSITHREDGQGIPRWLDAIFAALERNSTHIGDVLRLPQDETMELGGRSRFNFRSSIMPMASCISYIIPQVHKGEALFCELIS